MARMRRFASGHSVMTSLEKFHFPAIHAYRTHAWIMVGLIAVFAALMVAADGVENWTGLVIYGISALVLFLSLQPWRSYLELDHHGFRVVRGAQSTIVRWRDVTGLRPAQQQAGRNGGVAYTVEVQPDKLFGVIPIARRGVVAGIINAKLYGISDGQLYQLMIHLRDVSDSRARHAAADLPAKPVRPRSAMASRSQASASQMIDRPY